MHKGCVLAERDVLTKTHKSMKKNQNHGFRMIKNPQANLFFMDKGLALLRLWCFLQESHNGIKMRLTSAKTCLGSD